MTYDLQERQHYELYQRVAGWPLWLSSKGDDARDPMVPRTYERASWEAAQPLILGILSVVLKLFGSRPWWS
jgi:hypothetical protein